MPSSHTSLYPPTFLASSLTCWLSLASGRKTPPLSCCLPAPVPPQLQSGKCCGACHFWTLCIFTRRTNQARVTRKSLLPKDQLDLLFRRMAPLVARLLFLQVVLGTALVENIKTQLAIKNFRTLHVDYPKVTYAKGFQGYCNGLMSYVRGRQESWYCPKTHYVLHAPWTTIWKFCKYSESFCENYNEYCTLTQDSIPLTICSLYYRQPPTSCRYNSTLTNQRLYLLCSEKYDGEPIDIIGLY
ncbi:probable inactive ribonuclease-like protein 13 isoform X2 [Oryx dammah]|uniref:probable inactive ribonuclease-like protein 13 isoform X2 n=1 Tax=Oryx dammah TaxID=59534 RepID=UPI001A9AF79D|nr:probable inactive ribonuclease-like protein 13 isoform X2 [Oryx dammah]